MSQTEIAELAGGLGLVALALLQVADGLGLGLGVHGVAEFVDVLGVGAPHDRAGRCDQAHASFSSSFIRSGWPLARA